MMNEEANIQLKERNRLTSLSRITLIIGLLVSIVLFPVLGQKADEIDEIFKYWHNRNSPGMAVAVLKNNQVFFEKSYGMANLEHQIPNTEHTVFNIGSVSKQFTAVAIFLLEQRGELTLDERISETLDLPDIYYEVTIGQLLYHTSGVRDWIIGLELAGWRLDDNLEMNDVLTFIKNQRELNGLPGHHFTYSNSGYNLLAMIVAAKTGVSFSEWMTKEFFIPLGMHSTIIPESYGTIIPNRASGYDNGHSGFFRYATSHAIQGSGGIYSTLADMIKWVTTLNDPGPAFEGVVDRLNDSGILNNGDTLHYSGGQFKGFRCEVPYFYHAGNTGAYTSYVSRYLNDEHLSIIILSNSYDLLPPKRYGEAVANLFLECAMPNSSNHKNGANKTKEKRLDFKSIKPDMYDGRFCSESLATSYRIQVENDEMYLIHNRRGATRLIRSGEFEFTDGYLILEFLTDEKYITGFTLAAPRLKNVAFTRCP